MRSSLRLLGLLLVLSSGALLTAGEIPVQQGPKIEAVDRQMNRYIEQNEIKGAVVLVWHEGKIEHYQAYGTRNTATREPMTRDTIFRIYSMSKPITSAAIMILYDEGKLKLDDPVSKYLPEFKNLQVYGGKKDGETVLVPLKCEVTISDLLTHTAGLSYGFLGSGPIDQLYQQKQILSRENTLAEMVTRLSDIPLIAQPGTVFNYSVSIDVLGRIVEVASGQTFDKFLEARIFQPLGMKDTAFSVPEDKAGRLAATNGKSLLGQWNISDDPAKSPYLVMPRLLSGGGGLVSTMDDYLKFCRMLLNKGELDGQRILKAETVELMTRNHVPDEALPIGIGVPRPGVGFGYGFAVRYEKDEADPTAAVGEYGWGGAASTQFWISPKDKLIVIALRNFMPYDHKLEAELKAPIYKAIREEE